MPLTWEILTRLGFASGVWYYWRNLAFPAASHGVGGTWCLRLTYTKARMTRAFVCRSRPVSRVLSLKTAIYLGHASPRASSRATRAHGGAEPHCAPICPCFGWGLPSRAVTGALVRSYRTFPAFLLAAGPLVRVSFSIALSVGFPRPAVSRHPAPRSPDFPHGAGMPPRATVRPE